MYQHLRHHYWWRRMKKDIVEYVAWCLNYQQVKYEHRRSGGLLQRLEIPEWKWERVTMDFIVGLPQAQKRFDVVWVIVDRKKGKLGPRYIRPFEILEKIGKVAYKLAFPPSLSTVHLVFHVSMLQKYDGDLSHVLVFNTIQLDEDLTYIEEHVAILDRQVQKLKSKNIASGKVQWRCHLIEKVTWETKHDLRSHYPHLFTTAGMSLCTFRDENLF
ncbi:uncharacterized protein [Nicotiana sylvestris]|uniref:uncharacterized protein n=1 Tax=Nicotiana sylvestris TaxID=4096 RepID=UPI00388C35B3